MSHTSTEKENCVPFNSRCAPESVAQRLQANRPGRLTIREIRSELHRRSQTILTNSKKAVLVKQLEHVLSQDAVMISAEDDAMEKAMVGESLAVEQLAELGPSQARKVRQRVTASGLAIAIKREVITVESSTNSEDD
uniref:Uncharacterized protein n=1 Tax=Craspedostauros australis TaxID=1486917 RepID=A0A7R9WWQ3_9STRA|mmetsp:Transcript_22131/g.61576  ORF Transcript_22131/g.61576 Transcript_22131/m.61576 type:complete len:137 (+) Transcript_22131:499-909(+)